MTTPATHPDTPDASGSQPLASTFTTFSMSEGLNKMIHDIQQAWLALGITPVNIVTDFLDYVRISDGTGKGIWVRSSAVVGQSPLVNGGFDVWQDGATFTSIADGVWGPDGWVYAKAGAGVHDLLRSTDVPTVAQAQKANYSLQLDVTTADSSIAAGDVYAIGTRLEGYDWRRFAEKVWTIRFWVKAAKTGTHYLAARNSGNDRSCVMPYTVNVADTWEEKQVTFPASPSAGTWDYTNGRGIDLSWCLAGGSTYQTGGGVWATGNFFCDVAQVNELDNTANNFRIAMVGRPTLGSFGMPYVSEDYGATLRRAQRYLQSFGGEVTTEVFANGFASATTFGLFQMDLAVPMRAIPTATFTTSADFGISRAAGGLVAVNSGPTLQTGTSTQKALIRADVAAGLTAGEGCRLIANTTANARIKLLSRIP